MPISTVTAVIISTGRDTVSTRLSILPCGTITCVMLSAMLPFLTTSGKTISKGAPVGVTALNCPSATCCSEMLIGNGSLTFLPKRRVFSEVKPLKIPSGRLSNRLLCRLRLVNAVSPEKSPAFSDVIDLSLRLRLVTFLRCVSLISSTSIPIAAAIASRTCGVRSLIGMNPCVVVSSCCP